MKITIVIATFNAETTLEACLASIRAQTFRDFEIVVADGVSRDRTLEILRNHESEISAVVSEKDRGIYDAWNKVVPKASGDWLLFLGADDELWDANALARSVPYLASARENVVYGKVGLSLPDRTILNFEGEPWEGVKNKFLLEMTIPHQGVFHRRELFKKYGPFNPEFRICGDFEFLLRELKDHAAFFMPDVVVSRMGIGGVSSTYRNVEIIIRELSRARSLNGIHGVSPFITLRWVRYYTRSAIRGIFGQRASGFVADVYRRIIGKPALWNRHKE